MIYEKLNFTDFARNFRIFYAFRLIKSTLDLWDKKYILTYNITLCYNQKQ